LFKRFSPYFKKYRSTLLLDLFCAALTTLCELALPLIVRRITSAATNDISSLTLKLVLVCGGIYVFLRLVDAAAYYFMASVGHIMGSRIETDMRRDLFSQFQKLSFKYYDNTKIGQLMARISSDLFDITEFAHHCPEEFFIAGVKIIGAFCILLSVNVPLTLIIFSILPVMLFCSMRFSGRIRSAFQKSRRQIGEINAQVEDSLLGIRIVKSFANEEIEEDKFAKGNEGFLDIKKETYKSVASMHSVIRIFDGIMYIAVVVAGAIFLINGGITVADFTAYLLFVSTLLASIRRIVEFTEQFQRGMSGLERFCEVMDVEPDIADEKDAEDLPPVSGNIVFDHVSFSYSENEKTVLSDITLTVKSGETVALVGPSGSGKTTLCSLIPRFYDVTSGSILIDGHDIRKVTMKSLRSQVGVVSQDVYLFSGSVFENIEYGKPGATMDEVVDAAIRADAHEFIMQLPNGYDTYVGERGVKLSGGQKQRISIARAFLKNPPVLILDEATSSLDTDSEKVVQRSLEKLSVGRTTFTIAHRLTTIKNASVILVLTENGIEESGTHDELMKKRGVYFGLYSAYDDKEVL